MNKIIGVLIGLSNCFVILYETTSPKKMIEEHKKWLGRDLFWGTELTYYLNHIFLLPEYLISKGLLKVLSKNKG